MASHITRTREELRATLGDARPGLVPTMGALHAGHESLISQSASENTVTIVSVFVNPTQFSNHADLTRYPRDLDPDVVRAKEAGADLIFAPDVARSIRPASTRWSRLARLAERWEGVSDPGIFAGSRPS